MQLKELKMSEASMRMGSIERVGESSKKIASKTNIVKRVKN